MTSISYINTYKIKIKEKQLNHKPLVEKSQVQNGVKKGYSKKSLRKKWGLTIAGVSLLALGLNFKSKFTREFATHVKILSSLATGVGLGTGLHFLFTKKSKLKEDKLTNNYGKRLAVITGMASIAGLSAGNLLLKNVELSKQVPRIIKAKGLLLVSGIFAAFAATTYSLVEGIKGITDKSLKKEKLAQMAENKTK